MASAAGYRRAALFTGSRLQAPGPWLRPASPPRARPAPESGARSLEPFQPTACRSPPLRHDQPHIRPWIPGRAVIIPEHRLHAEARPFHPPEHLGDRDGPKGEVEALRLDRAASALGVLLLENREATLPVLPHGFDKGDVRST